MKTMANLKVILISGIIVGHLIFCVSAVPYPKPKPQEPQPAKEPSAAITAQEPSAAITAQSMNGAIAMAQSFMQLFSQLFNQFNSLFPRFVNIFTGTTPGAPGMPAATNVRPSQPLPSLPSLNGIPDISSLGSMPNYAALRPEKIDNEPNVPSPAPRDVELIGNDVIESAVQTFM